MSLTNGVYCKCSVSSAVAACDVSPFIVARLFWGALTSVGIVFHGKSRWTFEDVMFGIFPKEISARVITPSVVSSPRTSRIAGISKPYCASHDSWRRQCLRVVYST